jgi:hypothetical protein
VRIQAQERGRKLLVTVGGREDGMDEAEAAQADAEAVRVTVPPVTAAVGMRIWSLYAGIMFNEVEATAEADAMELVRMATGCWWDDTTPAEDRAAAEAQQALLDSLRWEEGNLVSELALYWNVQGGGIDVALARLQDGNPKAQEILTKRNGTWGVLSRLRTLRNSGVDAAMRELDGTSATDTPAGGSTPSGTDGTPA